jgi:hypothetical protein
MFSVARQNTSGHRPVCSGPLAPTQLLRSLGRNRRSHVCREPRPSVSRHPKSEGDRDRRLVGWLVGWFVGWVVGRVGRSVGSVGRLPTQLS